MEISARTEQAERDAAGIARAAGLSDDDAWRLARAVVEAVGPPTPRGAVDVSERFPERIRIGLWDDGRFAGPFDADMKNGRPDLTTAEYVRADHPRGAVSGALDDNQAGGTDG